MKFDISIIVPFYKRDIYAIGIYKKIKNQAEKFSLKTELLFVDAYSRTRLNDFFSTQKNSVNFNCRILDTIGYVSNKRNIGIKESLSDNLVIMDDDCVPDDQFIINHYKSLVNSKGKKILYCGIIRYDQHLINKYNYFRFRDECHRNLDNVYESKNELNFHNIVTMNMSFKKEDIVSSNLFFNENYNEYGFEDIQFGIDGLSKGFKISTNNATVVHQDSTSLPKYYRKMLSFSKNYYILFYSLNINYFKELLENNSSDSKIIKDLKQYLTLAKIARINEIINKYKLIKITLKLGLLIVLPIKFLTIFYLLLTDRQKFFYSRNIFKFLKRLSYIESFLKKQKLSNNWIL